MSAQNVTRFVAAFAGFCLWKGIQYHARADLHCGDANFDVIGGDENVGIDRAGGGNIANSDAVAAATLPSASAISCMVRTGDALLKVPIFMVGREACSTSRSARC